MGAAENDYFHSLSFKPDSRSTWTGPTESSNPGFETTKKGANVFLVNPYIPSHSQNPKINAIINITFPTSIGFIAGYLKGNGIEHVQVLDEQIYPLSESDLEAMVRSMRRPAIIGISVLTLNASRSYELAARIKRIDPTVTIVLGGIHPTVLPNEPFKARCVDFVVRGEGEIPMLQICQTILAGDSDFDHIKGLSYQKGAEVYHAGPSDLVEELDTIPQFPYEMFEEDLHKYPGFSGVFGSRGCPYLCTFCSARSMSGLKYRYHSVERMISEFKRLILTYKQESIFFMDDNIGVHRRHFTALCNAIIDEGLHEKAFFHGSMRGDNATDALLDIAKAANFKIIYFGLETGSERLMKEIKKGETVAQVGDAIRRAAARGISVGTTLIFGLPGETHEDRLETVRFVKSLPLASCRFNTLAPYPGTEDHVRAAADGGLHIKGDWENFGVQYMWESDDVPYVPAGNSRLQLLFDTMWANLSYYVSWSGLRKMFTSRYAGGNVIKLKTHWYFKPSEIRKFYRVVSLLGFRFLSVATRLGWEKLTNAGGHKRIRPDLVSLENRGAGATEDQPVAVRMSNLAPMLESLERRNNLRRDKRLELVDANAASPVKMLQSP